MLLVLAVIALCATVLLPGVNSLLRGISDEPPQALVWNAITAARGLALESNDTVWLKFDHETRRLVWDEAISSRQLELPAESGVEFLRPDAGDRILLGGVLMEAAIMPAVRFYPDGTCDRFRVQVSNGAEAPQILSIDPWTCAPMLAVVEARP